MYVAFKSIAMPIPFKIVQRVEPGVPGGGNRTYHASPHYRGTLELTDLAKEISQMSSLSRPDVMAVLEALVVLAPAYLGDGYILSLGNLGSLRVVTNSKGSATPEEVSAANVYQKRMRYYPSQELKAELKAFEMGD